MMLQNEQEYIRLLRERLEGTLSSEDLDDILSDYREHFRIGKEKGRSEQELFVSLGAPDTVAREIKATHFIRKAENTHSWSNILRAVMATLGLGLFNLVFVLVPFIILLVMLAFVLLIGILFTALGPVILGVSVLQILGVFPTSAMVLSPLAGIFMSVGITAVGILLIIGDFYLARFFYYLGIRYLKWNIAVITGTEAES